MWIARAALPLLVLVACSPSRETASIDFRVSSQGAFSGIETAGVRVARDATEWRELWEQHSRIESPRPPEPEFDFERDMVVFVSSGAKSTAGWSLEVEDAHVEQGVLVLEARESGPAPGTDTLPVETAPYVVLLVPRSDLRVELRGVP